MKRPLTNEQEVLFTLIKNGYVTFKDFAYLPGFRTRVSNLKLNHGLQLETTMVQSFNKFGNHYKYAIHKLIDKEHAKNLYEKLTVNN